MATHAQSSKQWTKDSLAELPMEGVFYLRGLEVTRLDTFVDAAYAFVLTLLVISFDEIPSNYLEMIEAIKRIPGFFASFVVLMIFWMSHRGWSRRFGLENRITIFLSLAIIFMILVYVYPLRMVFESMFYWLSDGYFTSSFSIASAAELRGLFVYYSVGFAVMSLLSSLLIFTTLRSKSKLCLSELELVNTRIEFGVWAVCAVLGLISVTIALSVADNHVTLAGFIYFFLYPVILAIEHFIKKRSRTKSG